MDVRREYCRNDGRLTEGRCPKCDAEFPDEDQSPMDDIAKIATGLSEAQRRIVRNHPFWGRVSHSTLKALRDRGVMEDSDFTPSASPSATTSGARTMDDLKRPIIGIEKRTPQEVFDIMVDRFTRAPDPRLAELEAERDGLRAIVEKHQKQAEWFYVTGYDQDECEMSIGEVLERMGLGIGSHVTRVDVAAPLPSIWCAVRILSDDEADALETDDRTVFTEHATEAEARAALGARP